MSKINSAFFHCINLNQVLFLITLNLTICHAKIKINVKADSKITDCFINFTGYDIKTVTDTEISVFNLTKANLNRGIRVELGKIPKAVYLKDPTPFDNLFEEFKWQESQRKMTVKEAFIVDVINEPILLTTNRIINYLEKPIKRNISIYTTVENMAQSVWSKTGYRNETVEFTVNITFNNMDNFIYTGLWRNQGVYSQKTKFGISKPGFLFINPNQTVELKLFCVKSVLVFNVTYTAKMEGLLIADYDELYGKYHFYSPSIEKIMKAAKIDNYIETTELIEVRFYDKPRMEMKLVNSSEQVSVKVPENLFTVVKKGS